MPSASPTRGPAVGAGGPRSQGMPRTNGTREAQAPGTASVCGTVSTPRKASYFEQYPERKHSSPYVPSPSLTPKVKLATQTRTARQKEMTSDACRQESARTTHDGLSDLTAKQVRPAGTSAKPPSNDNTPRHTSAGKKGLTVATHLPDEMRHAQSDAALIESLPDKPLSPSIAAAARAGLIQRQGVAMAKTQSAPSGSRQTLPRAASAVDIRLHGVSGDISARQWHSRCGEARPRQYVAHPFAFPRDSSANAGKIEDETTTSTTPAHLKKGSAGTKYAFAAQAGLPRIAKTSLSDSDSVEEMASPSPDAITSAAEDFGTMRRVYSHSALQSVEKDSSICLAQRTSSSALAPIPQQLDTSATSFLRLRRDDISPMGKVNVPSIDEIVGKHKPAMNLVSATVHETYCKRRPIAAVRQYSDTSVSQLGHGPNGSQGAPLASEDDGVRTLASFSFCEHAELELARPRGFTDSLAAPSETVERLDVGDRDSFKSRLQNKQSMPALRSVSAELKQSPTPRTRGSRGINAISKGLRRIPSFSTTPQVKPRSSSMQCQQQAPLSNDAARSFTATGLPSAEPDVKSLPTILPAEKTGVDSPQSILQSPKLNRIYRLTSGMYRGLQVSFADVGDPQGHPIFIYLGLGAIRFLVGLYDDMAKWNGLRLLCIDRWGLGRTDDLAAERRLILSWSEVVGQVADHLGIGRFSVMAHSAGAPYAMGTCIAMPDRIAGPVNLLAPWVGGDAESGYKWLRYIPDTVIRTAQAADWHLQGWRLGLGKSVSLDYSNDTQRGASDTLSPPRPPRNRVSANVREASRTSPVDSSGILRATSTDGTSLSSSDSCRTLGSQENSDTCTSMTASNVSSLSPSKASDTTLNKSTTPQPSSLASAFGLAHSDFVSSSRESAQTPHLCESSRRPPRQASQPSAEDFGTELLRASHAECSSSASTADLLVVLGRASQRPWGFAYDDVKHPVRVWHGEKDDRVGIGSALWMERTLEDCRVTVVKGAGHNLMTESNVVIEVLEAIARDNRRL